MDYNLLKLRVLSSLFIILLFLFFLTVGSNYLWLLFFILYSIFIYEIYYNFINYKNKFFLYIYVLISFIFLQLYLFYYFQIVDFIIIILTITIFDTSSYFLGSLIGQRKILSISPNKTYEGLFSGIIFTIIFMIIFNYYFTNFYFYSFCLIILLIILLSFLGDIIESYFKRLSNIKNSSKLIPGHGGFLDRFDSFILVTYGIFFYKFLII